MSRTAALGDGCSAYRDMARIFDKPAHCGRRTRGRRGGRNPREGGARASPAFGRWRPRDAVPPSPHPCNVAAMTLRAASCVLFALVFATNAFGQSLLWETIADLSGGTDIARAITLSKNAAVVIGNASNTQDEVNDFVVSALRRKDGATTWTDRVPTDSNVLGLQIASAAGRVFASGYAPPAAGFGSDIVVRGYDALSGALLWSSVWDEGRDDLPQALVAGPSAVVVVGYGGNTPGQNVSFLVRASNPASGAVLWDDRVQRSANGTAAWQVAVARNRVFVAGTSSSPVRTR